MAHLHVSRRTLIPLWQSTLGPCGSPALRWLLIVCACVCHADGAGGQFHARRDRAPYVTIPVDGDFETALKQLLQQVEGRQKLEELLNKARQNPEQLLKLLPEHLKDINPDNPLIRDRVKQLQDDPFLKNFPLSKEQTEAFRQAIEKFKQARAGGPPASAPPDTPDPEGLAPPDDFPDFVDPELAPDLQDERWKEFFEDWLQHLEESPFRDLFLDSPAFQQTVSDMEGLFRDSRQGKLNVATGNLGDWFGQWSLPRVEGDWLPRGDFRPRFGNWRMPRLPALNLRLPAVSLPRFGGVPSNTPVSPGDSWALVLPLLLGLGLLVYFFLRQGRLFAPRAGRGAGWQLGPWPVNPALVCTRGELVRAFDYLSLLRLGPAARHWNHQDVADRLGAQAGAADVTGPENAGALARLYEQARYAPADEPLPAEGLPRARACLLRLAAGDAPTAEGPALYPTPAPGMGAAPP